jgi:hypothetical protein
MKAYTPPHCRPILYLSTTKPACRTTNDLGHPPADGLEARDLKRVTVDTTVQPKATTFVGHNLRIVLDWLRMLLRLILIALWRLLAVQRAIKSAS